MSSYSFLIIGTISNAQNLFKPELELPVKGTSYRVTQRTGIKPGETISLFEKSESGAILHWWLTCTHGINKNTGKDWAHQLKIRIYYDEIKEPFVDMTLTQFFGILLENEIFTIDNAAIKVLPLNAFNCYFPIPFEKIKMELINTGKQDITIWFMADWHKYSAEIEMTKLRFTAIHSKMSPAERFGSIQMADFDGNGFIAGMFQAVSISDTTDAWFHTGGETFLLDGETTPRVIRGIGGEDVFNMSFGIWPVQTDWIGAPLTVKKKDDDKLGSEKGFAGENIELFLTSGKKNILVKLSNFNNMEWRNWAFNLKFNKL